MSFLAATMVCLAGEAAGSENIDPANDGHQYAWGENAGWFNLEPSGDGAQGVEVSDSGLTGWMWGENAGWVSLSCVNTGSCAASSYHVGNDGLGTLSGFAWGENIGWVNFSPTACQPDPTCGVKIDAATGYFRGRAWSENAGWITFASAGPIGSTARTGWCSGTGATPGMGFTLSVSRSDESVMLSWTALSGATSYDVVSGRLSTLASSEGDFTVSTEQCLAERFTSTSSVFPGNSPSPGDGLWFLVRGTNCRGHGTFDSDPSSQSGTRDGEIAASGHGCH